MKFRYLALIAALIIISIAIIGCHEDKEPDEQPPETEKQFVVLDSEAFESKAEEFTNISNYMSLIGIDFSYKESGLDIEASVDLASPDDVMVGLEYEKGESKLSLALGGGRLYVDIEPNGKKDSMRFDNNLTVIMNELAGGDKGMVSALGYLTEKLKQELGAGETAYDKESLAQMIGQCTILFRDGEVDEYKIYANHSDGEKLYESTLAEEVCIEFKVNGGCIIDLDGKIVRGRNEIEFSLDRRTNSSPMIDLPDEVYSGDFLDDFEELYENRAVTIKDFEGEWRGDGYALTIGSSFRLFTPDETITLTMDSIMANYLTLVSDSDVYVAHLVGDLELTLPNGSTIILKKA